jgi:hypothetical protein
MKPINYDDSGCNPISSNCVLWQGPDIECIDLCKGDTVSEVVYKLATELCTLLDKFNVDTYDISCFDLKECAPETFEELIQLLIEKVCACCGVDNGGGTTTTSGCPDCEVNICSEFYYQNPQGDTITTMQLKDYVVAIGNKVCQLIGQINTINQTLIDHEDRITILENATAPEVVLPQVTPTCVIEPAVPTDMDVVLTALETQFCDLRTYTGFPADILLAIQKQCAGLNSAPQLNGSGTMQDIAGWNSTVSNLAQSFSNLWLTVCDLRNSVTFIQDNCCDTDCGAVDIDIQATVLSSTQVRLDFVGSIPGTFIDASPSSTIVITDSSGAGPQTINNVGVLASHYNLSAPLIVTFSGGIDGNNDINISMTLRVEDPAQGISCESIVQAVALGLSSCPDLFITSVNYTSGTYSFTWNGSNTLVSVELWNQAESINLQSVVVSATTGATITNSFTGLTDNTTYKVRLVILGEPCEFVEFTTLAYACIPPVLGEITIDYDNPSGI